MGLLDDAIREHLELKRRAGADATDVARQEQEALGAGEPDEPLAAASQEEEYHYGSEVGGAAEPEVYDHWPEDYADEPDFASPAPPAAAVPPPPPPSLQAPPPSPPPVEAPAPPVEAPPPPPPVGPATEEYRLAPATAEPEDVLEQTPDFLQETPEHDRLWFEQAPPQEFDFDK